MPLTPFVHPPFFNHCIHILSMCNKKGSQKSRPRSVSDKFTTKLRQNLHFISWESEDFWQSPTNPNKSPTTSREKSNDFRGASSLAFCPFLSFWDFPGDFPDLLGDGPGNFPICPFPLSRPIKSTYEEQSRKGPRHNLDLSRKKWETPRVGNTPVSFSQQFRLLWVF